VRTAAVVAACGVVFGLLGATGAARAQGEEWRSQETLLSEHVQLTKREQFVKAGEAYFGYDARWIIFQAVPVPPAGATPHEFYSMYVAKLLRSEDGRITGLGEPILVSPPGSANTCGWFHPREPYRVLFGSTLGPPTDEAHSGFQVRDRQYKWAFPIDMELVTRTVPAVYFDLLPPGVSRPERVSWHQDEAAPLPLFRQPGYDAEASWSVDGRWVLYTRVDPAKPPSGKEGEPDADIWVFDTETRSHAALVTAPGYDGGAFIAPDQARICYRSDRAGDGRMQLYVADLNMGPDGVPVGIKNERAVTANSLVNFGPFWTPGGEALVYAASSEDHRNYDVWLIKVPRAAASAPGTPVRITHAPSADLLPVVSEDRRLLMWTSQRGGMAPGEERPSSQVWIARFDLEAALRAAE